MASSLVIHIPHASTVIPADVRPQLVVDDERLAEEVRLMTDHLTDALFAMEGAQAVAAPVSRLVVDVERFEQDEREVMAAREMGVVYERCAHGEPLRRPVTAAERAALLDRWHRPHHRRLAGAVRRTLEEHRRCLVIDAHSFPSVPLPYESDQDPDRPDICLGTDAFHTPNWLGRLATRLLRREGWMVAMNRPFAGALVPSPFYGNHRRVRAVKIEVNRRLYLDEATAKPRPEFNAVRAGLARVIRGLQEAFDTRR